MTGAGTNLSSAQLACSVPPCSFFSFPLPETCCVLLVKTAVPISFCTVWCLLLLGLHCMMFSLSFCILCMNCDVSCFVWRLYVTVWCLVSTVAGLLLLLLIVCYWTVRCPGFCMSQSFRVWFSRFLWQGPWRAVFPCSRKWSWKAWTLHAWTSLTAHTRWGT